MPSKRKSSSKSEAKSSKKSKKSSSSDEDKSGEKKGKVVETGIIYFFYRYVYFLVCFLFSTAFLLCFNHVFAHSRVCFVRCRPKMGVTDASKLDDVQKLFMLMKPSNTLHSASFAILSFNFVLLRRARGHGRHEAALVHHSEQAAAAPPPGALGVRGRGQRGHAGGSQLPRQGMCFAFSVFVFGVVCCAFNVCVGCLQKEYDTKTRGHRTLKSGRVCGEGLYEIIQHEDHCSLACMFVLFSCMVCCVLCLSVVLCRRVGGAQPAGRRAEGVQHRQGGRFPHADQEPQDSLPCATWFALSVSARSVRFLDLIWFVQIRRWLTSRRRTSTRSPPRCSPSSRASAWPSDGSSQRRPRFWTSTTHSCCSSARRLTWCV